MAITITERAQLEKLVVLMFNAAPGADYLAQVVGLYEALGHNLQGVADALDDVAPFQSLHPNFQTAVEFAADFLSPLGLQNDATAKAFVVEKFNAGVSKGEIMFLGLQALDGLPANAPPQYLAARAILQNKAAVSEYYSVTKGISNNDVGILQTVLNGVTADAATVTSADAEIDAGTRGLPGITPSVTDSQDTIIGTNAADLVNGLFGGSDATLTAGDTIDGGGGADRVNLVATSTTPSAAVIIKNVETINIQDTVGATFNALLVENAPAINFNSTQPGLTSSVFNAALGSVIGLAGKGNLLVDYANTSGSADTANVALNGAGSASSPSTVNVADGNTVEAVKIATSGANFVNLLAGTAAGKVTITGDGTNTFEFGSIQAVATIDASAATGPNTFNLGATVGNGDVIKGGTGMDSANFTASSALGTVTFNGIETVKAKIDADVALNLGASTGLQTLTLADGSGSVQITNATSELTTVNYQSTAADDVDNDFSLAYKTGQVGNLTFNLGTAAASQPLTLDALAFTRVEALTIDVRGTQAVVIDNGIDLDKTTQSLAVDAGDSGSLEAVINAADDSALKSIALAADDGAYLSCPINARSASGVAVTVTGGEESVLYTAVSAGSFGDTRVSAGADAQASLFAVAKSGGIGDFTLSLDSGAHGYVKFQANYAGSNEYGDIDLSLASGATADATFNVSERDIGNVFLALGASADATITLFSEGGEDGSGNYVSGGNIGDLHLDIAGDGAHAVVVVEATAGYSGSDASGGNLGDVVMAAGDDASIEATISTDGGNQGNYDIAIGASGIGLVNAFAGNSYQGDAGNVGDIAVDVGEGAAFTGRWIAVGAVGDIDFNAGNETTSDFSVFPQDNIGAVNLSFGDDATARLYLTPFEGRIGPVTLVTGERCGVTLVVGAQTAEVGATHMSAGEGSNLVVTILGATGDEPSAGIVTAAGGLGGSVDLHVEQGPYESIDLHDWLGTYSIGAHDANVAVIFGGQGGGTIHGGDGSSDQLTGGAGADDINGFRGNDIIDGGAGNDTLLGGFGLDVIDGGNGNDIIDGGPDKDVMTGGAGADMFVLSSPGSMAFNSAVVTDTITDFATQSDAMVFGGGAGPTNFFENSASAGTLADLLLAAGDKLDGTVQYYFGVAGGDGYLVYSSDGLTAGYVIQLSGVTDIAASDILAD